MIIALAVAVTGITVTADKAKAETVPETTEAPVMTEAPAQAPTQAPTATPAVTPAPQTAAPVITPSPVPTATAEPTEKPSRYKISAWGDDLRFAKSVKDEAIPITKGFTEEFELCACFDAKKDPVKWTVADTSIAKVTKVKNEKKGSMAVIKGKKYGKTTLTAEYDGQMTTINIKVVKNEYVRKDYKIKKSDEPNSFGLDPAKAAGKKKIRGTAIGVHRNCATAIKYDKKGNLVIKYYEEIGNLTKFGKKEYRRRKLTCYNMLDIEIYKDHDAKKPMMKYKKKIGKGKYSIMRDLSVQHPTYRTTVVVPKSKLKGKLRSGKVDLRRLYCSISRDYNA